MFGFGVVDGVVDLVDVGVDVNVDVGVCVMVVVAVVVSEVVAVDVSVVVVVGLHLSKLPSANDLTMPVSAAAIGMHVVLSIKRLPSTHVTSSSLPVTSFSSSLISVASAAQPSPVPFVYLTR